MGIDVTSFYTYRWRYWIGYGFIGVLLVGLFVFAGLYVPGGIFHPRNGVGSQKFDYFFDRHA